MDVYSIKNLTNSVHGHINPKWWIIFKTIAHPGPNSAWSPAPPHFPPAAECTRCRWAMGSHVRRIPPSAPEAVCRPMASPHRRTLRAAWTATDRLLTETAALWWISADSDWRRNLQFALRRKNKDNWSSGDGHCSQMMMPGFHTHFLGNYFASTLVRTFLFM